MSEEATSSKSLWRAEFRATLSLAWPLVLTMAGDGIAGAAFGVTSAMAKVAKPAAAAAATKRTSIFFTRFISFLSSSWYEQHYARDKHINPIRSSDVAHSRKQYLRRFTEWLSFVL